MLQTAFNMFTVGALASIFAWMLHEKRIDKLMGERIDNLWQQIRCGQEGQDSERQVDETDDRLDSGMHEGAAR